MAASAVKDEAVKDMNGEARASAIKCRRLSQIATGRRRGGCCAQSWPQAARDATENEEKILDALANRVIVPSR